MGTNRIHLQLQFRMGFVHSYCRFALFILGDGRACACACACLIGGVGLNAFGNAFALALPSLWSGMIAMLGGRSLIALNDGYVRARSLSRSECRVASKLF